MLVARAARAGQVDQAALAVLVVGVGKGDDGLVQLGVMDDLAERLARREDTDREEPGT